MAGVGEVTVDYSSHHRVYTGASLLCTALRGQEIYVSTQSDCEDQSEGYQVKFV